MLAYTPTHRFITLLFTLLLLFTFTGCAIFENDTDSQPEIIGHWQNGTAPDYTTLTVSDNMLTVHAQASGQYDFTNDYAFEIVSFDNNKWKTDDNAGRFGNRGYLLLRYTSHNDNPDYTAESAVLGKYTVLRWHTFTGTNFSYQEGYTNPYPEDPAAALQMCFTNGFSDNDSWYTEVQLQQ